MSGRLGARVSHTSPFFLAGFALSGPDLLLYHRRGNSRLRANSNREFWDRHMTALIEELKGKIIEALNLEGMSPMDIKAEDPLFGEGLGLDSIDALELVVMLERDYGIVIQDKEAAQSALASVHTLAETVHRHRNACPPESQS